MDNHQLSVKSYPFYKDSEVEWLEKLPNDWEVKRLKEVLAEVVYGTSEKTKEFGKYEVLGMGDIDEGKVDYPKKRFIDNVPKELLLKKEDLLFNRTNSLALVGKVGLIEEELKDVTFASYLIRLRLAKKQCSKYFWYLLNSEYFINYSRSNAIQTANQANLSSSKLKQFKILCIAINLQKSIAAYLDMKTAQCDRKIDLLTQKATQYGKLKQSLINETVNRGLDKSVAMKDSGVEWIGEVPEHWQLKRLKDIGTSIIGITYAPEDALGDKTSGLLVLRSSNIQNGRLSLSDTVYVNKKVNPRQIVKKGDILICSRNGSRALIGKNICIDERTEGQTFGAFMTVYRSKYFRFISKFFNSNVFESQSGLFGSSTINQLTVNTLNNFLLILPPLSEQKMIADYLDKKTAQIDQIIKTINTQIEKLKELRKTLINDVVTGKIKVIE